MIPGHGITSQSSVSSSISSSHDTPSYKAGVQIRDLDLVPGPHVIEHASQSAQGCNTPSTELNCNQNKGNRINKNR